MTIEGLTIRGAGRGQFADFAGIYVVGSGAILKRVILQDNNVGVIVTSPPAEQPPAQILESTFTGNDKDIEVWSRALIRDNRFDDEVAVDIGGYAEIRKNKGTILRINGAALVEENRFMQVKVFSFSVPDLPTILRSNQIIGTGKGIEETGVFEEGLTIKAASPLTVEDNLISQHGGSAIVIDQSSAEILLRRNIITNSGYGLWLLRGFPQLVRVEGNTIERNLLGGVLLISEDEEAHFEVVDNLIRLNQGNGIMIGIAGRYLLQGNKILDNDYWGVIETIPPCVQEDLGLRPQVTGSGNEISGNGKKLPPEAKALGDGEGNVCPKELLSLKK
ncbi:MAG: right-handed parallel beta-helix repeat-containing protein [Candidatus Bipolaricaulia bacterium]